MTIRAWISVLLILYLLTAPARAQERALAYAWQRSHAPAGMSLENRASAIGADGSLVVLGLQRPLSVGKDRSADKGWIGIFSASGAIKDEFSFVLRAGDRAVQEIDALAIASNGQFIVAGQALDGESLLVAVGRGTVKTLRSLGKKRLAFVLCLADGDLVLGGRDGRDLYAAWLKADGTLVREHRLDRGFDELFVAGVAKGGDVVMLEHSGVREQFFMRDAVAGLTVLNKESKRIGAPGFSTPGRAGALVSSGKGYALLIDTGTGVQQNLKFMRLNEAFKSTTGTTVLSTRFSLERARMARRKTGGYIVAAMDGITLIFLQIDEAGAVTARLDNPPDRGFLHPDVISADETFAVATEVTANKGSAGAQTLLYVAKFASY